MHHYASPSFAVTSDRSPAPSLLDVRSGWFALAEPDDEMDDEEDDEDEEDLEDEDDEDDGDEGDEEDDEDDEELEDEDEPDEEDEKAPKVGGPSVTRRRQSIEEV